MKKTTMQSIVALFSTAPVAINGMLTPQECTGTDSLHADAAIAFRNAVVMKGSDDRHFAPPIDQADAPYGVLLNDEVAPDEVGVIKKNVAVFGLFKGSIPCLSDGSSEIEVTDQIIASVGSPGKVKKMPSTSGQTYVVIGRPRFAVAASANEPVSLIHCVPYQVTNP